MNSNKAFFIKHLTANSNREKDLMARNESETRAELVDPALRAAGWGVIAESQIRREFSIAEGRLTGVAGQRHGILKADYLLIYKGRQLVVLEAKSEDKNYTEGLQQAKDYDQRLDLRFACSTNGKKISRGPTKVGLSTKSLSHFVTSMTLKVATGWSNPVAGWVFQPAR